MCPLPCARGGSPPAPRPLVAACLKEADFMAAGQAGGGSGSSFAHLHVHTEYSMLDGAARLNELFAECERAGMTAVAITDHGNLYGAYDFWTKAQAACAVGHSCAEG